MRNILSAIAGLLLVIACLKAAELGYAAGRIEKLEKIVQEERQEREGLEEKMQKSNVQHKIAYIRLKVKVDAMKKELPPCDLSGFVFKPEEN